MSAVHSLARQTARQTQDGKVKEFCFADVYYLIVQDEQYKRDSRVVQHMLLCRYIMYIWINFKFLILQFLSDFNI